MILLAALGLGLLAGWALAHWQRRQYRAPELTSLWLIPLAFAPQVVVAYLPRVGELLPAPVASAVLPLSLIGFLAFVWLNRRLPGMPVLLAGLLLNLMVITANGGWMPISPATASQLPGGSTPEATMTGNRFGDKDILLEPGDTKLEILSDRFLIPEMIGYRAAFSPGDLLIAAGAFWLLASPPRGPQPKSE
jgi:hypothetical protein